MGWSVPRLARRKPLAPSAASNDDEASRLLNEIGTDIRNVGLFWAAASALGVLLLTLYSYKRGIDASAGLALWALGIAMLGATVGFLFGIPKVLQGQRSNSTTASGGSEASTELGGTEGAYVQRVNTNLEEISDWLTKIIVGVGLVELKQLPPLFDRFAKQIEGIAPGTTPSVCLALLAFFLSTGFLFGYLLTRLYLQGALARADRQSSQVNVREFLRRSNEVKKQLTDAEVETPEPNASREALEDLAKRYLEIDESDPIQKLSKQDELAKALYIEALRIDASRDELAQSSNEALLLTLASLAHAKPTQSDVSRLLDAGKRATRHHVRYRIVMALAHMVRENLVLPEFREPVRDLLQRYLKGAEPSLQDAIRATLESLGEQ